MGHNARDEKNVTNSEAIEIIASDENITFSSGDTEPHQIIQEAQKLLGSGTGSTDLSPYVQAPYLSEVTKIDNTQQNPLSLFDKFPDVSSQLRDDSMDSGVDLYRVRKLNLAATVETLERAVSAHESFPSADAGIAVAKLADQVNQLTKELEKAQDPYMLYGKIVEEAMEPLTTNVIKSLVEESKWLVEQFEYHVPEDKRHAFRETVKQMVTRVGPSLKDSLELAKTRLLGSLNLQDRKNKK